MPSLAGGSTGKAAAYECPLAPPTPPQPSARLRSRPPPSARAVPLRADRLVLLEGAALLGGQLGSAADQGAAAAAALGAALCLLASALAWLRPRDRYAPHRPALLAAAVHAGRQLRALGSGTASGTTTTAAALGSALPLRQLFAPLAAPVVFSLGLRLPLRIHLAVQSAVLLATLRPAAQACAAPALAAPPPAAQLRTLCRAFGVAGKVLLPVPLPNYYPEEHAPAAVCMAGVVWLQVGLGLLVSTWLLLARDHQEGQAAARQLPGAVPSAGRAHLLAWEPLILAMPSVLVLMWHALLAATGCLVMDRA